MSIDRPGPAGHGGSPRRPPGSGRWAPAGLLALAVIPVVAGTARLLQVLGAGQGIEPDRRFDAFPVPVVGHVVTSIIFIVLGAFQFSARTRRRHPLWHRRAGRMLVPLGLTVAGSALWMTLLYDRKEGTGELLYVVRLVVATGMAACLVLGLTAIRRRDIAAHRAWMARAYALALGAGTQAFTVGFGEALLGTGVLRHDLTMSSGWALNLTVAELLTRRSRRRPTWAGRQLPPLDVRAVIPAPSPPFGAAAAMTPGRT